MSIRYNGNVIDEWHIWIWPYERGGREKKGGKDTNTERIYRKIIDDWIGSGGLSNVALSATCKFVCIVH